MRVSTDSLARVGPKKKQFGVQNQLSAGFMLTCSSVDLRAERVQRVGANRSRSAVGFSQKYFPCQMTFLLSFLFYPLFIF